METTTAQGCVAARLRRVPRRFAELGLQARTMVLLAALVIVVTVSAGWIDAHLIRYVVLEAERQHAGDAAESLAVAGSALLSTGRSENLRSLCTRAVAHGDVHVVEFFDANGAPISEARRADAPALDAWTQPPVSPPAPREPPRVEFQKRGEVVLAIASRPLTDTDADGHTPRTIGWVRVGHDATDAVATVRMARWRVALLAGAVLLVVLPAMYVIVRQVSRPLNRMAAVARRFACGDLTPRVRVRGADEIARLAETLNVMADRLSTSRAQLIRFNSELEQRVQERTRELVDQASRDPLTNLYNRRHFDEVLIREFAAASRYGHDVSLLMVDLDHFKQINDHFGHRVGDDVLMLAAKVIADACRSSDVAARYGGDEFIVLMPETSEDEAEALAERIREALRLSAASKHPGVPVGVSVGIASLRGTLVYSADALVQEVDKALYCVKRNGRGWIAHAHSSAMVRVHG